MINKDQFQIMRAQLNKLKEKNEQFEADLSAIHERFKRNDEETISISGILNYILPSRKKKKNTHLSSGE